MTLVPTRPYRLDIDGMRALAVVAVILHHRIAAGWQFPLDGQRRNRLVVSRRAGPGRRRFRCRDLRPEGDHLLDDFVEVHRRLVSNRLPDLADVRDAPGMSSKLASNT